MEGGLRNNRIPPEGFTDPVMSDRIEFRSNIPVSKLIKRIPRAIEASDVASTPPVVRTADGVTCETQPTPIKPQGAQGLKPLDLRSRDRGSKASP